MVGIQNVATLESLLVDELDSITTYFVELFKGNSGEWGASEAFLVQLILIKFYLEKFDLELLMQMGWHKGIAERVIRAANAVRHRGTK